MRKLLRHIPNLLTSLNLASGSVAVFLALEGHLLWAGVFVCLAAVLDFLDGLAARLLNAYSDIGKELDSLADMISFGLAPTAIFFTLLKISLSGDLQQIGNASGNWSHWVILLFVLIMPVMSALRLARFNVKQSGDNYFLGLPTPSNGLLWASLGMMLEFSKQQELFMFLYSTHTLLILGLLTSGMLVINLPMFSLKFKTLNIKDNWYRYLFLLMATAFLVAFHVYGLALTMLTYIFMNILFHFIRVRY